MRDWVLTVLVCVATGAAGLDWAAALAPGVPRYAKPALGYLMGAALVTLTMMLLALPGLPVNRVTTLASFLLVAAAGRVARRRARPQGSSPQPGTQMLPVVVPLLAVVGGVLAYGVVNVFTKGHVTEPDFLHAWGLRGIYEFAEHSMTFAGHSGPNLFYPLEISNMDGALWIALGHVNDTVVRLPMALFAISFVPVMWWLLRFMLPPAPTALGVALAVCTPQFVNHMTNGIADLPVGVYITIAALACVVWVRGDGAELASLAGFAAGAAAWTKLEGAPTTLVLLATVMLLRRRVRSPGVLSWVLWFALFTVPWQVFIRVHGIVFDRSHFKRLYLNFPWIIRHVWHTLVETSTWGIFWPLCLGVILLTAPLWWRTPHRILAFMTLPNVVFTLFAYVTHFRTGIAGSVTATASRLYLHLAPGVAAMTAAAAWVALQTLTSSSRSPTVTLRAWRRRRAGPRLPAPGTTPRSP